MDNPKRRINVYVCGILTSPGHSRNWTGRAVTHSISQHDIPAEKIEYLTTAFMRVFGQQNRVTKLASTLEWYKDREVVLVGHSNGADVCVRCLRENHGLAIKDLHLVCGATNSNFTSSGLNRMLQDGTITGRVYVYIAGQDKALALTRTWLARFLGYGTLGLTGPKLVSKEVRERVIEVRSYPWTSYGHSTCWQDERFERTMSYFI